MQSDQDLGHYKSSFPVHILILCGGKGERLRPFTGDTPKPLIKINGKPILGYIIDHIHSGLIK